jgi:hypothetical protein
LEDYIPVMQLPPVDGPEGSDLGDLNPSELGEFLEQVYIV